MSGLAGPRARRSTPLLLLGVTVLAAALALFRIGAASYWYDEAFSIDVVEAGYRALADLTRGIDITGMTAYYALLRTWVRISTDEAWVRGLSALFAIAAVPATWILVRRLWDVRTATIAAVLLAVQPFAVRYAQEARSYSLVLFLSVVTTHLLVRAVQRPTWRAWLAYAAVASVMPYAHVVGGTLLAAHALAALVHRPRPPWRMLVAAAIVICLALVPLAASYVLSASVTVTWIPRPSLGWVADQLTGLGGGGPPSGSQEAVRWIVGGTSLALAGAGALVALGVVGGRRRTWPGLLVVLWAFLPLAIALAVSFVEPMFLARYLIGVVPALAILAAIAIAAIRPIPIRVAALTVAVAVAAIGIVAYYRDPGKADWRGATAYLQAHATSEDRWLVDETWAWLPIAVYADRVESPGTFPVRLWRNLDSADADGYARTLGATAEQLAGEGRVVWVIVTSTSRGRADVTTDPRYEPFRRWYRATDTTALDRLTITRFEPISSAGG